jgi:hypothetical protein
MQQIIEKSWYLEPEVQYEQYVDFSSCQTIPSEYHHWTTRVEEATDQEILLCAAASASYSFLDEPEEDIYDCSDGQPL